MLDFDKDGIDEFIVRDLFKRYKKRGGTRDNFIEEIQKIIGSGTSDDSQRTISTGGSLSNKCGEHERA